MTKVGSGGTRLFDHGQETWAISVAMQGDCCNLLVVEARGDAICPCGRCADEDHLSGAVDALECPVTAPTLIGAVGAVNK